MNYPLNPLILLVLILLGGASPEENPQQAQGQGAKSKGKNLGPCQTCRILVGSFINGISRVSKENKAKKKVKPVKQNATDTSNGPEGPLIEPVTGPVPVESETEEQRQASLFKEIMKGLCAEVKVGRDQCMELGLNESLLLEEWWQSPDRSEDSLVTWMCIERLKCCCPWNHFGPVCTPCTGYPRPCSGHGKCKGNGTRKGNGGCICDRGYKAEMCDECDRMHYEAYRDEEKVVCAQCHRACLGGCAAAGPKGCDSCNEGWETDEEKGCIDMNECLMLEKSCKGDEFCVNTEGSYACFGCDRSCDGCYGDGPDMCEKCAEGYTLIEKLCIDGTSSMRDRKVDIARYLTYFGLCVSTCIIFQKNMAIASVIGVAVGVYIATSEYLLNDP